MGYYSSLLSLSLCFVVLFNGCIAQRYSQQESRRRQQEWQQNKCQLNRINALEPSRKLHSEAGITEIWDVNDEQFQCAGVVAVRHTINQRGLLLPQYVNGPKLIYVLQGNGVQGAVFPGCPETYQSSESQSQSQSQYSQDQRQRQGDIYQKIRQIREGDIVALPTGVAQWVYNNGRSPLVLVVFVDAYNPENQLDQNVRVFFVGGNPEEEAQVRTRGQQVRYGNVLSGIDEQLLAEAFNINSDVARRLKGENDNRGIIVNVEGDLDLLSPQRSQEEEQQEREEERQRELERQQYGGGYNGIEETFCTARLKHNIDNPSRADIYNLRGGRVTNINSHNLPILRYLQFSVQKGVLYRNAIIAPHWNFNAHSVSYFTRGSGHVQIVDDNGNRVFDGPVKEGQILTAPQNFVVVKKASSEGLEWVAFKTNDNAQISPLAGRVSAIRAMPDDVVANAYQVSIQDARRLKENRQEVTVFSPWSRSRSN